MRVQVSVMTDLGHHQAVADAIESGRGPVKDVMTSWERRYRSFITRRFDRFSAGGGDWKKNSPLTIALKGSSAILVDSRVMRLGLATAIRVINYTRNSMTFSFVNEAEHPAAKMSISALLTKHDKGIGTPKRPILVEPDAETRAKLIHMARRRLVDAMNGE